MNENNNYDIFKQARECVTESLIRFYFDHEGSEVYNFKGDPNLKIKCPFRADKKIGSFSINLLNGYWYDNSGAAIKESGDFIHLVELTYRLSPLDAAKKIIHDAGGQLPEIKRHEVKKEKKHNPVIPIPEEKLKLLNNHVAGKFITEKYGTPSMGWKYRQPDGKVWMCVTRHIKENGKQDLPYKFCDDGKWHAGCPVDKKRHLYNIDKFNPTVRKILTVEGNKCADVEVNGYLSITWWGGGNQVDKYNWKAIETAEEHIIWPDYDKKEHEEYGLFPDEQQPGLKAALQIKKYLPNAKILNVYDWCRKNNKPDGWDIYDAREDGLITDTESFTKFIEEVGFYDNKNIESYNNSDDSNNNGSVHSRDDNFSGVRITPPFIFMGHDDGRHYFLVDRSNIIKSISFGNFSNGKLLELAPLSYWVFNFPKKDGFDLQIASDWIINESERKGFYKKENVRGAGVWMDDERIIINSGHALYDEKGQELQELKTKYFYTHSQKQMGTFSGDIATNEQGAELMNLFLAQGFETELEAFIAAGWTLIAPFAGILKWRPHIWITGPKGCGKSHMLENFIQPILGTFSHIGSGKDSAPGIYRSVKSDPVPILLDEMEPGKNSNKESIRKIEEKLELARNASSDFSGHITLANVNSGGADSFFIRSPFCFSSVVPYMHGEAIESRILTCRLKNMSVAQNKIETTKKYLKTGLLNDPGIFRRKIFSNLRYTIQYIDMLRDIIRHETGEIRKADNLAPLFAATFSVMNEAKIPDREKVVDFVKLMVSQFDKTEVETDEDKLMRAIFDYTIRVDASKTLSIAELINDVAGTTSTENIDEDKDNALKRHGIKFHKTRDDEKFIAIATAHKQLQDILENTMYSGQYVQVLKRHPAYSKNLNVSFAGQNKNAVLLRWNDLYKKYFKESEVEEIIYPF